jgi:hypothetical protein
LIFFVLKTSPGIVTGGRLCVKIKCKCLCNLLKTGSAATVFNCFSKASGGLQTAFLKSDWSYRQLFKSWGAYTDFREAFEKPFAAPMHLENRCYTLQQEGLGQSVKILKHFA